MARSVDPKQRLIHRLIYVGIALVLVIGTGFMLMQSAETLGGSISLEQLEKNLGQDPYHYVVIDVRRPDEYRAGHIPHSINMPLDQLPRRLAELHEIRDRQFVLVCESGARSEQAVALMKQNGFKSVVTLPVGTRGWRESGRALVTSSRTPLHDMIE